MSSLSDPTHRISSEQLNVSANRTAPPTAIPTINLKESLNRSKKLNLNIVGTPPDASTIKGGAIGRGFNVLYGETLKSLFDDMDSQYKKGKGRLPERVTYFPTSDDYEKELVKRVGITQFEDGMFSLYCGEEHGKHPLMCKIERQQGRHHFLYELEEEYYRLEVSQKPTLANVVLSDPDVKFIMENSFTPENKYHFYTVFDRYGTHWVKKVIFGSKVSMRWSFVEKTDSDTLGQVSYTQNLRKQFMTAADEWKAARFSPQALNSSTDGEVTPRESKDSRDSIRDSRESISSKDSRESTTATRKIPKNCEELRNSTENWYLPEEQKRAKPCLIAQTVEEITTLFPPYVADQISIAIRAYLAEMKPLREMSRMKDASLVAIYCLDTHRYLGVDTHGHLYHTDQSAIQSAHKFEIKKKGNRVGLKSVMYGKKFLSKAMTKSIFHFHRLQFMGPHESFEVAGDFIYACGSVRNPTALYIGSDNQIHHDGKRKNRFCLLSVEARESPAEIAYEHEEKEPLYEEDDMVEITISSERPLQLQRLIAESSLPIHKSNSTSSLFIKDTITLPNIDELSRRMAYHVHNLIEKGHATSDPVFIEILSEEKHPLTRQVVTDKCPSVETVFHFLNTIFKVEKLSPEPGIMCLVYLNRVITKTNLTLHASNWRRIVLCTLILASKVWEDLAVWNVDFIELFPNITVKDLNRLERFLLECIEFNVSIKTSEYVKTFFGLGEYGNIDRDSEARPLDEEALKKLEVKTAASEKAYFKLHKSSSLATLPPKKAARGILS